MIADVEGYYTSTGASAYMTVEPFRYFDSRDPDTPGKLPAGYYYSLAFTDSSDITSIVLNTTVTNVTGGGYLTVFPDNTNGDGGSPLIPNASNLNFGLGPPSPTSPSPPPAATASSTSTTARRREAST